MTHSNVCHDSFKCVPWCIQICAMTRSDVRHDAFKCVTRLIHRRVWDVTHEHRYLYILYAMPSSNVCHHSFKCVTWLIPKSVILHLYVTWLVYSSVFTSCTPCFVQMRAMKHSNVWPDSFKYAPWRIQMCAPWLIQKSAETHLYVTWLVYSYVCVRDAMFRWNLRHENTTWVLIVWYGVATISRLHKIIGRFCTRAVEKRLHSAKETYFFAF